ncbi:MAG: gfo/Idh/MocA family oxidoreductase [Naasia sp.]|jgi:predicted dehydrogenase|uniref:Gfo/Idh/MocA family protein n=1 Tax=Naasia sp. TaxID=2546198 RepID=UPI002614EE78|nr:Gfo/Idh/MocA family oxidoreductase [Naasia sp.]MCU1569905.1 gfo/Idh/MocA family oxidoreductase [Naasia sp.]
MSEQIGWGILATGGIAKAFTRDLAVAGLTAVAVGSRSQESADAFGQEFGVPHRHPSYEALVQDPDVDIVYIATPHPGHAEAALLALEAGKHVLIEKPFTVNADEARKVTSLAAEKNLLVLEAMWPRFLPHMIRLHEILDDGTLGDVRTVIADHNQDLPKDPKHRINNPDLGGGALLDLGIYPVSFAVDMLGAPTRVSAMASFTATGVDRQTAILLEHEGGRQSLLHTALDTKGPNTASVIGTLGRVDIDSVWYSPTSFTVYDNTGGMVERYESSIEGRGMQYEALEAERLIRAGEIASPRLSPAESVAIMDVLDDIRSQIGLRYPGEAPA